MKNSVVDIGDPLVAFATKYAPYVFPPDSPQNETIVKGLLGLHLGLHRKPAATVASPTKTTRERAVLSEEHKNVRDFPHQGDIVHHPATGHHIRVDSVGDDGTVHTSTRPAGGGNWGKGSNWTHNQWQRGHNEGSLRLVRPSQTRQTKPQSSGRYEGTPLKMSQKDATLTRSERDERDIRAAMEKARPGDRVFLRDGTFIEVLSEHERGYIVQKSDAPRKGLLTPKLWRKACKSLGVAVAFAPLEKSEESDQLVPVAEPEVVDMRVRLAERGPQVGDEFASVPRPGFSNVDRLTVVKSEPNGMLGIEEIPWADMSREIYVHTRSLMDRVEDGTLQIVSLAPETVAPSYDGPVCRKCGTEPVSSSLPQSGYCNRCLTVTRA